MRTDRGGVGTAEKRGDPPLHDQLFLAAAKRKQATTEKERKYHMGRKGPCLGGHL